MYIAHVRETDQNKEEQALLEHLYGTQNRCREFGEEFGNGEFAAGCGILHDIGKYSDKFQSRIRGNGGKCDHATAGANIAYDESIFGKLAAYCIAGHHSGLQDSGSQADTGGEGTLFGRLSDEYSLKVPDYEAYKKEIDTSFIKFLPKVKQIKGREGFTFAFFTHMIYSCLTDSDFLDTECFMSGGKTRSSNIYPFEIMKEKLEEKLNHFSFSEGLVNIKRNEILESCIATASCERGLYRLTVPTGERVIIVMGAVCVIKSRVSGTLNKYISCIA